MSTRIVQTTTKEIVCKMFTILNKEIILIFSLLIDEALDNLVRILTMPYNRPFLVIVIRMFLILDLMVNNIFLIIPFQQPRRAIAVLQQQ